MNIFYQVNNRSPSKYLVSSTLSPFIHASISCTVLGTLVRSSTPTSVMSTSSSIRTPPKFLNRAITSGTKNDFVTGSANALSKSYKNELIKINYYASNKYTDGIYEVTAWFNGKDHAWL